MALEFLVRNQRLKLFSGGPVVADSQQYLKARFTFSEDWQGTRKYAQFRRDGEVYTCNIDEYGEVEVPWETLVGKGVVQISAFATNQQDETNKLITTNPVFVKVETSGIKETELPKTPSLGILGDSVDESLKEITDARDRYVLQMTEIRDVVLEAKDHIDQTDYKIYVGETEPSEDITNAVVWINPTEDDGGSDELAEAVTAAQNAAISAEEKAEIATQKASDISASAAQIETNKNDIALLKNYVTPEMFKDYDGNDWTLAINRAITVGLPVVFKNRIYTISSPIEIVQKATLIAEGATMVPVEEYIEAEWFTCFKLHCQNGCIDGFAIRDFKNKGISIGAGAKNCIVKNCNIYNASGPTGAGFSIGGEETKYNIIQNCVVYDSRLGFTINGAGNNTVVDCQSFNASIYSFGVDGVITDARDGGFECQFINCYSHATLETCDGFYVGNGSYGNSFLNCKAVGGRYGFASFNGDEKPYKNFISNFVAENSEVGIYSSTGSIDVKKADIKNSKNYGIHILNVNKFPSIIENVDIDGATTGLFLRSPKHFISNCIIQNCSTYDIDLEDSAQYIVLINVDFSLDKLHIAYNKSTNSFINSPTNRKTYYCSSTTVADGDTVSIPPMPNTNYVVLLTGNNGTKYTLTVRYRNLDNFGVGIYDKDGNGISSAVDIFYMVIPVTDG